MRNREHSVYFLLRIFSPSWWGSFSINRNFTKLTVFFIIQSFTNIQSLVGMTFFREFPQNWVPLPRFQLTSVPVGDDLTLSLPRSNEEGLSDLPGLPLILHSKSA